MNQKELREIRKRFKLDKDSISHVYGCYVNAAKDIVARDVYKRQLMICHAVM